MAFDILEKEKEKFLSQKKLIEILGGTGIKSLNIIKKGFPNIIGVGEEELENTPPIYTTILDKLLETSHYGPYLMEGFYFRIDSEEYNEERAKYVRPEFTDKLKEGGHWRDILYRNHKDAPKNKSINPSECNWT